ncbi:putative Ig domain-containing protein [Nostoc sphaeroides CHAB 2801]|uniref:putative Ig domain-containing protein n=1 Tax=Nostoc sphaeroides TaxID=446679 RepID=UPI001E6405DC|nr:putative Ig domain-containing protein [Nostoc sphaeroides]MCC5633350.1 putative Ig domain-containing protein [Nostoc sphaeroides CHAB 2801]
MNPIAEIIQLADYKGQLAGILADMEALKQKQPGLPETIKTLLDNTLEDIHTALQAKETLTIQDNLLNTANALIEQSNTLKADVAKLQQEEQRYLDLLTQSETDLQGATKVLYDEIQKSGVLDSEKTLLNAQNIEILYKIGYAQGAVDLSSNLAKQSKEILEQVIGGRIEERKAREKAAVNNILGTITTIINVVGTILSFTPLAPIGATLKVVSSALSAVQAAYNGDWAGAIFNTAMAVVGYQQNNINTALNDAEKTLTTAKNAQNLSEAVQLSQIAEATEKLETLRTTLGPTLKSLQTLEATIKGTYATYTAINSGDNTLALLSAVQGVANVISVKGLKLGETLDKSTNFSNFEKALITAGQISVSSYEAINAIEKGNPAAAFKSLSNIAGTIAGNFATELKQQEHKNLNLIIVAAKESENIYKITKSIEDGEWWDALKGIGGVVKSFRNALKEKNQDPPTVTNNIGSGTSSDNTGNDGGTSSVSVPQELSLWNKIERYSDQLKAYADKIEQKLKKEIGLDFNQIENIGKNVSILYNLIDKDTEFKGLLSGVQKILNTWDKEIDQAQLTPLNQVLNTANILTDASTLTGVSGLANTNNAPILGVAIADQIATEDTVFSFTIPENTFSDSDVGDTLTYSATLENGNGLPSWLTFDTVTRTLNGIPAKSDVGTLNIKVIATDNSGSSVNDTFTVAINPPISDQVLNGTAGNDSLIGNNSHNIVTGLEGADTLTGNGNELNNNIVGFDKSNDVINRQGDNVINGLSGNDLLRGGSGNDILIGGAGNDTLVGGEGADRFLYNTDAPFDLTAVGVDTITDFNSSQGDKIVLDQTTFSAFPFPVAVGIASTARTGFSNLSDFQVTSIEKVSSGVIVYNPVSGQLFYNPNGSAPGFGSGGLFATLNGAPTVSASDFVLQA